MIGELLEVFNNTGGHNLKVFHPASQQRDVQIIEVGA